MLLFDDPGTRIDNENEPKHVDHIMKLKTVRKKIRRLEARLQEGPKKLAKLKRKLEAMRAASVRKSGKKSAARRTVKSSTRSPKTKSLKAKPAPKKVKRKLNLSPERRAQLAAAMKARWAAKRAANEANPQNTSPGQDFAVQEIPHSPLG